MTHLRCLLTCRPLTISPSPVLPHSTPWPPALISRQTTHILVPRRIDNLTVFLFTQIVSQLYQKPPAKPLKSISTPELTVQKSSVNILILHPLVTLAEKSAVVSQDVAIEPQQYVPATQLCWLVP